MSALVVISTTKEAVTSTAATFQLDAGVADPNPENAPQAWRVRVWGDVNFHVCVDGQAATQSDFPIAAGREGELFNLLSGGLISVVTQAGEADGTVFFSRVKRQ